MIYDRVRRNGPLAINYVTNFREQSEKPLVVIFPAVSSQPGLCLASYFFYNGLTDADVIHVIDNIGSYGSYFLARYGERDALSFLISVLSPHVKHAQERGQRVIFAGTSKGGTIALLAATGFDGIECIVGEPQIKLGHFLIHQGAFREESSRCIAHTLTFRADPNDKDLLDEMVLARLRPALQSWGNSVSCIIGDKSGYDYWHINPLLAELERFPAARSQFDIIGKHFTHHNDVITHFIDHLAEIGFRKP